MIMPMTTNTTIATCSQIQVGDIAEKRNDGYSTLWKSAASVSSRILKSRPSDQLAM
jgi:hypothetical protein